MQSSSSSMKQPTLPYSRWAQHRDKNGLIYLSHPVTGEVKWLWSRHLDPKTDNHYLVNTITGERTWVTKQNAHLCPVKPSQSSSTTNTTTNTKTNATPNLLSNQQQMRQRYLSQQQQQQQQQQQKQRPFSTPIVQSNNAATTTTSLNGHIIPPSRQQQQQQQQQKFAFSRQNQQSQFLAQQQRQQQQQQQHVQSQSLNNQHHTAPPQSHHQTPLATTPTNSAAFPSYPPPIPDSSGFFPGTYRVTTLPRDLKLSSDEILMEITQTRCRFIFNKRTKTSRWLLSQSIHSPLHNNHNNTTNTNNNPFADDDDNNNNKNNNSNNNEKPKDEIELKMNTLLNLVENVENMTKNGKYNLSNLRRVVDDVDVTPSSTQGVETRHRLQELGEFLTQQLLKVDAVESNGNPQIRAKRKDVVNRINALTDEVEKLNARLKN